MTSGETNKEPPEETLQGSTDAADCVSDLMDLAGMSLDEIRSLGAGPLDQAIARILVDIDNATGIISSWSSFADH